MKMGCWFKKTTFMDKKNIIGKIYNFDKKTER